MELDLIGTTQTDLYLEQVCSKWQVVYVLRETATINLPQTQQVMLSLSYWTSYCAFYAVSPQMRSMIFGTVIAFLVRLLGK